MSKHQASEVQPVEFLCLAGHYAKAADCARHAACSGDHLSWSPTRLLLMQAIELYLTAWLRHRGVPFREVRAFHHKLYDRALRACEEGLVLRPKTLKNLESVDRRQEYTAARYLPSVREISQLNQLEGALLDIQKKLEIALTTLEAATPETAFPEAPRVNRSS